MNILRSITKLRVPLQQSFTSPLAYNNNNRNCSTFIGSGGKLGHIFYNDSSSNLKKSKDTKYENDVDKFLAHFDKSEQIRASINSNKEYISPTPIHPKKTKYVKDVYKSLTGLDRHEEIKASININKEYISPTPIHPKEAKDVKKSLTALDRFEQISASIDNNKEYVFPTPINPKKSIILPSLEKPSPILDKLKKAVIVDPSKVTPIEAPTAFPVTPKMAGERIMIIRRRKMKKHQVRKRRKRNLVLNAKIRHKREVTKEKTFISDMLGIVKEAEEFNPDQYIKKVLYLIKNRPQEETYEQRYWRVMDLVRENKSNVFVVPPRYEDPPEGEEDIKRFVKWGMKEKVPQKKVADKKRK